MWEHGCSRVRRLFLNGLEVSGEVEDVCRGILRGFSMALRGDLSEGEFKRVHERKGHGLRECGGGM